jgi:hypothetical protein
MYIHKHIPIYVSVLQKMPICKQRLFAVAYSYVNEAALQSGSVGSRLGSFLLWIAMDNFLAAFLYCIAVRRVQLIGDADMNG